jgi:hypothetical protein
LESAKLRLLEKPSEKLSEGANSQSQKESLEEVKLKGCP